MTPIDEITALQLGSRPARRAARDQRSIDDLRAIPWVFAWSQARVGAARVVRVRVRARGLPRAPSAGLTRASRSSTRAGRSSGRSSTMPAWRSPARTWRSPAATRALATEPGDAERWSAIEAEYDRTVAALDRLPASPAAVAADRAEAEAIAPLGRAPGAVRRHAVGRPAGAAPDAPRARGPRPRRSNAPGHPAAHRADDQRPVRGPPGHGLGSGTCGDASSPPRPPRSRCSGPGCPRRATPPAPRIRVLGAPADPVLVGAGDISTCANSGDTKTANLIADIPGTVFTAGRQRLPGGRARRLRGLLRPDVGRVPGPHPAEPRQPRLRDGRCLRLLRVLRVRRGRTGRGLVRLRPRRVADLRPQLELRAGRRLRRGLAAAAMAEGGPRREPSPVRPRVLASPALQLGLARQLRRRSRASGPRSTRPARTS